MLLYIHYYIHIYIHTTTTYILHTIHYYIHTHYYIHIYYIYTYTLLLHIYTLLHTIHYYIYKHASVAGGRNSRGGWCQGFFFDKICRKIFLDFFPAMCYTSYPQLLVDNFIHSFTQVIHRDSDCPRQGRLC